MNKRKLLIFIIVIANLGFVWSIFNIFYYKKASFDTSKKATIISSNISKIHNGDGGWIWNENQFDFYKEYSFSLNKNEIPEFCKIVNTANAKYIENNRPSKWVEIYIIEKNGDDVTIILKQNNEDGVYFEFENHTFEGKELEKYIYEHLKKN